MAKNLFNRYIWLVDTIRAGKITFEEINRKWLRTSLSEGNDLSLRTFHNHRTAIEDIFDINIECDNHNGHVYYIANEDDIKNGSLRTWLLNTFAVNNLINESRDLKNRILFEEIPSGQRFLTTIIESMRDSFCIEITYQPFWLDTPLLLKIEPYCLKIFKQRWYVIARNCSLNEIRTYSLDRIRKIETTNAKYEMPKAFNAKAYFENSFGIEVVSQIQPCTVKIKAFGDRRNYLQTLSLHHSQEEIETHSEYSVFRYYIAPTYDFKQELLSCSDEIEVLSPVSLRKEIAETIKKMKNLYKEIT